MFHKYLNHNKLLVRFGSLLGLVLVVFFSAWTISYFLLPEGSIARPYGCSIAGRE